MSSVDDLHRKIEYLEISRDALIKLYKMKIEEARSLEKEVSELQARIEFLENNDPAREAYQKLVCELQGRSDALDARISSLEEQVLMQATGHQQYQHQPGGEEDVTVDTVRPISIRNRTIARLQVVHRSMSVETLRTGDGPEEEVSMSSAGVRQPQVRENRASRLRTQQILPRTRSASAYSNRPEGRANIG